MKLAFKYKKEAIEARQKRLGSEVKVPENKQTPRCEDGDEEKEKTPQNSRLRPPTP